MNYNCGYWPFKSVRFSSFQVSNMDADIPYKFNIVNCEKINSQFNFGELVFMSNRISIYSCRLFTTLVVSYVFFKLFAGSWRALDRCIAVRRPSDQKIGARWGCKTHEVLIKLKVFLKLWRAHVDLLSNRKPK